MKKNICVITGTRAEYGLLRSVIKEINNDKQLDLLLFVTGSHLEEKFGYTYKDIEKDGFQINEKINMNLTDDSSNGILKSMSKEMSILSDKIKSYKIDLLLVLGDRYEILIAATVALINNIPIAHSCGGDITEGAYDDNIRNSITMMSEIHFVSSENSLKNVLRMTNNSKNVYLCGNPGLSELYDFKPLEINDFYGIININKKENLLLVVYHPETKLDKDKNIVVFDKILDNLKKINNFNKTNFIFIHSNADSNNNFIFDLINLNCQKYENFHSFISLDRNIYLNLISYCNLFIGNSSSGIYEVPFFKKFTINIGDRQKGREKSNTIIEISNEEINNLKDTINLNINKKINFDIKNPYPILNSSKIILKEIKNYLK
jgi:GDP/UDP-N,N'-diacetylbacillosamine 2-epimerase (hydrolysing)